MYWQYYNLERDPFAPELASDGYYFSSQWQQLLDLIVHLSDNSQAVLMVTGISGVGKTTLLRKFISRVEESADICKVQGDVSLTPDVLRYLLAKHLGFAFSDGRRETFNQQLNTQLEKMQQRRYLLVIDDAHLLPEKALAAILDIATQQPKDNQPLHVILFGGPQVEATVADITAQHMGEGVTHTSRIKPMSCETIRDYIQHRLSLAGLKQEFPLNDEEVIDIFQHSGGVPAKVNFYARQALETKTSAKDAGKKTDKKDKKMRLRLPKKVIFYGLGSVLTIALTFVALIFFLGEESQPEQVVIEQLMDDFRQHTSSDQAELSISDELNITALHDAKETPLITLPLESAAEAPAPTFEEVIAEKTPVVEASEEKIPSIKPGRVVVADAPIKVAPPAPQKVKPKVAPAPSKDNPVEPQGAVDSVLLLEKQQLFISDPAVLSGEKTQIKVDQKFKPSSLRTMHKTDEDNFLSHNKNHYTLQLMGAYDKQRLHRFVDLNHLEKNAFYFHTKHNGKDWYIVTYGNYNSAQAARRAIHGLPQAAQKEHPWARQFSSVQPSSHKRQT